MLSSCSMSSLLLGVVHSTLNKQKKYFIVKSWLLSTFQKRKKSVLNWSPRQSVSFTAKQQLWGREEPMSKTELHKETDAGMNIFRATLVFQRFSIILLHLGKKKRINTKRTDIKAITYLFIYNCTQNSSALEAGYSCQALLLSLQPHLAHCSVI